MNVPETLATVNQLQVVTLIADRTDPNPESDTLLTELGNQYHAIPYLAIFPGDGRDPITLPGQLSSQQIIESLQQATAAADEPESESEATSEAEPEAEAAE